MRRDGRWDAGVHAAVAFLAAVALGGCASGPRIDEVAARPAVILSGPDTPTIYAEQARAVTRTIARPIAQVESALRQVYADYGIPLTVDNRAAMQFGNPEFHRTRTFAGRPLTELVGCGSSVTGPNAASYRVYISLLTSLAPDGKGGTIVAVTFNTYARDMVNGSSNNRLPCGTTGRFEQIFFDRVVLFAP